jgi:hypothetical protein
MHTTLWLVLGVLLVSFIVIYLISKKILNAVVSASIIAVLMALAWLFMDPWFAPWFGIGLLAWASVFSQPKLSDKASVFLYVGQVPMLIHCMIIMSKNQFNWGAILLSIVMGAVAFIVHPAFAKQ